jgi:hypothetical protein
LTLTSGECTATKTVDAALAFYRGLKVYPTPGDLMSIYDKTISKVRAWRRMLDSARALADLFSSPY